MACHFLSSSELGSSEAGSAGGWADLSCGRPSGDSSSGRSSCCAGRAAKTGSKIVQDLQRPRTDTEDPRSLPWRTKVSNACQTETAVSKNEPLTDKNAKDNMPIEPFQALGSKHGCETPNRSWSCS